MAIIGAILGDIAGSSIEFTKPKDYNCKTAQLFTDDSHFTDDTILTIGTKFALMRGDRFESSSKYKYYYIDAYKLYYSKYPNVGYGWMFLDWLRDKESLPYESFGNGSAMRISPIADKFSDSKLNVIEKLAEDNASISHNHPEGIKGAVTTAKAIIICKQGGTKEDLLQMSNKAYPKSDYAVSSERSLDEMRNKYRWSPTCQDSVPLAIRCVYEADSYEEFLRNVFSFNCDADTIACIGGGIAEELFGGFNFDECSILQKYLPPNLINIINQEY